MATSETDSEVKHVTADELQFQDFSGDSTSKKDENADFTSFPVPSPSSFDEEADLLTGEQKSLPSFWTFEYYQSLFDVDAKQVSSRIIGSMIPRPGFIQRYIKSRPDLYGPFWICATLVFTIAISGNIADYLKSEGKKKNVWRYDFHKVSFAATAIYTYALFVPLMIWGLLWYRGSRNNYSLMQIVCVYGYSLSIYIPLSILWLIYISWIQWSLVILGSVISGSVLLMTFWPAVKEDENKKFGYGILLIIFVLHMVLAVGFMTYFFHGTKHKSDFNNIPATAAVKVPENLSGLNSTLQSIHNEKQTEGKHGESPKQSVHLTNNKEVPSSKISSSSAEKKRAPVNLQHVNQQESAVSMEPGIHAKQSLESEKSSESLNKRSLKLSSKQSALNKVNKKNTT